MQPLVKSTAPDFKAKAVINGDIKDISLSQYKGKFVILLFYPLDFTFVCPTEIIAFSDRAEEFKKLNAEVLGISVDSEYAHHLWSRLPRSEGGLSPCNLALVSDLNKDIARSYGLFIIDGKQVIRHCTINDLPIGRSVDETLRTLEAIQFTDKHGEIKPTPEESRKYFKELK